MSVSRHRCNPNRHVSFDALEGRVLMSTGVVPALHSQPHADRQVSFAALESRKAPSAGVVRALQAPPRADVVHAQAKAVPPVLGSFKGSIQLTGTGIVVFSGMTGELGNLKLTGHGLGEATASQFEGGVLILSGSRGTLTIDLRPAPIKKAPRGAGAFNSTMIIEGATGGYAADNGAVVGSAGNDKFAIQQFKKWSMEDSEPTPSLEKMDIISLSELAFALFVLNHRASL